MSERTRGAAPFPRIQALFEDPARDSCPGARPIVAVDPEDDPRLLEELEAAAERTFDLERRGRDHGTYLELREDAVLRPKQRPKHRAAELAMRWNAGRPIVLHGALGTSLRDHTRQVKVWTQAAQTLAGEGGLAAFLGARKLQLPGTVELLGASSAEPTDPDRHLGRVDLRDGESGFDDLWIQAGRLSTHGDDSSIRMRFSFGREVEDDASQDEERHRAVERIARALFPPSEALHGSETVTDTLGQLRGRESYLTQHILYWNAPSGGALFHHDAFDEPEEHAQRGVCYAQLAGRTAWLALSLEDLSLRVRELFSALAEGEMPWLREELDPEGSEIRSLFDLSRDWRRLAEELAQPGCGRFGVYVNRGPEITSWLADSGHMFVLGPGDVILLPNHGLQRTAMHSVFCASERMTLGLSTAIRDVD